MLLFFLYESYLLLPTGTKAIAHKNPCLQTEQELRFEIIRVLRLFIVAGEECIEEAMRVKISDAPKAQKTNERMFKLYLDWAKEQKQGLARMLMTAPSMFVAEALTGKANLPDEGNLCHHSNSDRKTSMFGMVKQSVNST